MAMRRLAVAVLAVLLAAKAQFALTQGLRGVSAWELSMDDPAGELLDALSEPLLAHASKSG
jgi:hypothetical protein